MTAIATNSNAFDLLPETESPRRGAHKSRIAMASILICVSSTISSSLLYTANADREVNGQYASSISAYTAAAHRVRQAAQLREREQATVTQVIAAAALPQQMLRSVTLASVARSLPDGMSLTSVSIEPAADNSVVTSIVGTVNDSQHVAEFLQRLGQSGLFEQVAAVNPNPPGVFQVMAIGSNDWADRPVVATAASASARN